MRRREFIAGIGSAMVSPLTVFGQDPGRPYNVGALHLGPWDAPHHLAFRSALRRLGFIEGYNLSLDKEGDGLRREQFDEHAVALVEAGKIDLGLLAGRRLVSDLERPARLRPDLAHRPLHGGIAAGITPIAQLA